ncbi:MAG: hypothetical protein E7321_00050 [Clostridiales bacterium]|nr:hypothetical protein [Clostridiales bacterium]
MNVSAILHHVMLELDEDPADINDYDQKFMMYLNMGYQLILRQHYKPRETYLSQADERGMVNLSGYDIDCVVQMQDEDGRIVHFRADAQGDGVYHTTARDEDVVVVCQVTYPPLSGELDVPRIPEHVHYALVQYICYKHLSSGNLAKQSRAQYYKQSFYEMMSMLKPVGTGSVTTYTNFYSATN